MRILILTDQSDRHFYFCNEIIRETGHVVGVIVGGKEINRGWWERARRVVFRHPVQSFRQKLFQKLYKKYGRALKAEKKKVEAELFGDARNTFFAEHSDLLLDMVLTTDRSINDQRFVDQIRLANADVIAVMGTCILGQRILSASPIVLNMHTGLSPYYRGGRTNFWPFVEGEPGYFGVTVHKMSSGIDTGDILYSKRVIVEPEDTYSSINCKSIVTGTGLMIRALKNIETGTDRALPQWTQGKVFHDRDWTFKAARAYFENRENFIKSQIVGETRGDYGGIKTVRNGSYD